MSFANPWMLTLLVPWAFAAWRLLRRGRKAGIRFSAVGRLPARTAGWRAKAAALTPYVLLTGLLLLVVAAARPRTSLAHEKKSVDALAIAMTVDVSGSMNARDLTPKGVAPSDRTSRLAIVKRLLADFVVKRPDDLIGLVTFATYAATVSPLTADHDMLQHALKGVSVPPEFSLDANRQMIGERETLTAMGDGIATALARLKDAKPTSKIIILLSDGVSNTGAVTPEEATEAAKKMGVKIYIIGIGVVPEYLEYAGLFGQRIRKRTADMEYEALVEALGFDPRQLERIVAATGGTYYPVNDSESLKKALEEIDQLETTKLDADVYNRWAEHFVPFLLAGAVLILLAVSLSMSATRRMA